MPLTETSRRCLSGETVYSCRGISFSLSHGFRRTSVCLSAGYSHVWLSGRAKRMAIKWIDLAAAEMRKESAAEVAAVVKTSALAALRGGG